MKETTNSDVIERVARLIKQVSSYKPNDVHKTSISKIWNNGMGRLDLCHVDEELGVVFINCWLATERDKKRILDAFPDFAPYYVEYGYPDYYFHSFISTARKIYKDTQHVRADNWWDVAHS